MPQFRSDGDRDHVGARRLMRFRHDGVGRVLAGADDEPRLECLPCYDEMIRCRNSDLTATVTMSAPDASCAFAMTALDGYLPVPMMSRDWNVFPAMTR